VTTPRRRRSLLEDDGFAEIGRSESSGGDLCERCGCTRGKHGDGECACGKCDEFLEFDST
jgi:hypothetical protein